LAEYQVHAIQLAILPHDSHISIMTNEESSKGRQLLKAIARENESGVPSHPKSDNATSWFVPQLVIRIRASSHHEIVAAQDTTEITARAWAGRRRENPRGDEAMLGVVHAHIWTRSIEQKAPRRSRTMEDKESFRWIDGSTVGRAAVRSRTSDHCR
jgi:hypothetical protein